MEFFDYPKINVSKRSNEQNMQAVNAYLCNMADQMNYAMGQMQSDICSLRKEMEELKNGKQ